MIEFVKANLLDIASMQNLVKKYIEDGIILDRSDDEVATNIRSYILAKSKDEIIGYLALHIHSLRLAEIRSLIVSEKFRGQKVGSKLVKKALKEAKELGVKETLVLTYSPEFFKKIGFFEIPKETIPEHKIWTDCIKCIHFPICNEVALIYKDE
jgi:amino-acid N-acetyltransferase